MLADDLGISVTRATEALRPVTLQPDDALLLARDAGSPALISHRVSFANDDTPIIDDIAVLPGDSVVVTANRNPDGLRLSYTLNPTLQ